CIDFASGASSDKSIRVVDASCCFGNVFIDLSCQACGTPVCMPCHLASYARRMPALVDAHCFFQQCKSGIGESCHVRAPVVAARLQHATDFSRSHDSQAAMSGGVAVAIAG